MMGLDQAYRGASLITPPPPQVPTVSLCLGPRGLLGGWAFSYERGAPVTVLKVRILGYNPV